MRALILQAQAAAMCDTDAVAVSGPGRDVESDELVHSI